MTAGPLAVNSASETCLPAESDNENAGAGALVATDGARVRIHATLNSAKKKVANKKLRRMKPAA
jgi:hypothetical protein